MFSPAIFSCTACVCVCVHSLVSDSFVTPWTIACQAPLLMGFSRQQYWSGLPCPPPRDLSSYWNSAGELGFVNPHHVLVLFTFHLREH